MSTPVVTLTRYWAPWCRVCAAQESIIERVARRSRSFIRLSIESVDVTQTLPDEKLGVIGVPTLIIAKGGKEVERIVGYCTEDELEGALDMAGRA